MRFPSIIPSLPGRVDPRYTAQQQAMRREKELQDARDPEGQPTPGPGVGRRNFPVAGGRMNFVPGWGVAVSAARRMSTSLGLGASNAARRMSTTLGFGANAARRMSTTLGFGFGGGVPSGTLRNGTAVEKRVSTLSVPSIYSVASRQNGIANPGDPQQQRTNTSELGYDNGQANAGVQLSPIRPLRLPNRLYTTKANTATRPSQSPAQAPPPSQYVPPAANYAPPMQNGASGRVPAAPPSSFAPPAPSYPPSTRSGASNRVPAPPPASLRSNKTGWNTNGLPPTPRSAPSTPSRSGPNTPTRATPNAPYRTELGYYKESTTTSRSATSASGAPQSAGRNRLKTATRYNLL